MVFGNTLVVLDLPFVNWFVKPPGLKKVCHELFTNNNRS